MRHDLLAGTLVIHGLMPSIAIAQGSVAEQQRRAMVAQAEEARARGDHAAALESASRALAIRPTPSLRLMLAQTHQALGNPVAAFEHATNCYREAQTDPSVRNREAIINGCRSVVSEVEPLLARLVVRVTPAPLSGLRVRLGGREVPASAIGSSIPAMPGPTTIHVTADGMASTRRTVSLRAGAQETVSIALLASSNEVGSQPSVEVNTPEQAALMTPTGGGLRRALGWVAIGGGLLGIGLGVTGLVLRGDAVNSYNTEPAGAGGGCPGTSYAGPQPVRCQERLDLGNLGESMVLGGFVAGGALAITGIVLLATGGSPRDSSMALVQCGSTGLGLHCSGRF